MGKRKKKNENSNSQPEPKQQGKPPQPDASAARTPAPDPSLIVEAPLKTGPTAPSQSYLRRWFRFTKRVAAVIGAALGLIATLVGIYSARPIWSIQTAGTLRSKNAFQTQFVATNMGTLPATEVFLTCNSTYTNMDASDVGWPKSGDVVSNLSFQNPSIMYSPDVAPQGQISVNCPQTLRGFRYSLDTVPVGGPPPVFTKDDSDLPLNWVDFHFSIRYNPVPFLPFLSLTKHLRMVGRRSDDGGYVWNAASPGQIFGSPKRTAR